MFRFGAICLLLLLFVLLFCSVAVSQDIVVDAAQQSFPPCQLVPQTNIRGVCTRSAQCTGPNAYWVASVIWGRRRARGCDNQPRGVRCCVRVANGNGNGNGNGPSSTTTTTTLPMGTTTTRLLPMSSTTTTTVVSSPSAPNTVAQAILDFHNDERRCFGLPDLTWSDTLARQAVAYAGGCQFQHSTQAARNNAGENLAAGSGQRDAVSLLQGWLDEQFNWNCATGRANGGGVTGHYTQMIWASTTQIGCGSYVCHSNSPFGRTGGGTWTNVVCRYSPAGNFVGRHPLAASGRMYPCGSCARSVRTEDQAWGVQDDGDVLEVCVPSNAASADSGNEDLGKCTCPDAAQAIDGPCAPPAEAACANRPVTCKDGTTLYPRQPDCTAVCPEVSAGTMMTTSMAVTGIAAVFARFL